MSILNKIVDKAVEKKLEKAVAPIKQQIEDELKNMSEEIQVIRCLQEEVLHSTETSHSTDFGFSKSLGSILEKQRLMIEEY